MTGPTLTQRAMKVVPHGSRFLELIGFAVGLGIIVGDKVQEWHGVGSGVSGTTMLTSALLIAPFTVGRASSGKAWEAIAAGISRRIGGA